MTNVFVLICLCVAGLLSGCSRQRPFEDGKIDLTPHMSLGTTHSTNTFENCNGFDALYFEAIFFGVLTRKKGNFSIHYVVTTVDAPTEVDAPRTFAISGVAVETQNEIPEKIIMMESFVFQMDKNGDIVESNFTDDWQKFADANPDSTYAFVSELKTNDRLVVVDSSTGIRTKGIDFTINVNNPHSQLLGSWSSDFRLVPSDPEAVKYKPTTKTLEK